jgi:glucose-6-phosphate isomerase
MTTQIARLTQREAWKRLGAHHEKVGKLHLRKLFADDPTRGERMNVDAVSVMIVRPTR